MAWIDDFEKKLNALVATHAATVQNNPQNQALDLIRGMNQLYAAQGLYKAPAPSGGKSLGHGIKDILKGAGSGALWAIDKVERPLYGIENVERNQLNRSGNPSLLDYHAHGNPLTNIKNVGKDFLAGLTEKQKVSGSDVLKASGLGKKTSAIGGFGVDLFEDPINFAGAPAKAGIGLLKGLRKGSQIAEDLAGATKTEAAPKTVQDLLKTIADKNDGLSPVSSETIPPELSREIHVGSTGDANVRTVRALAGPPTNVIAGRALLKQYDSLINKIPVARFGKDTKIAPNWNDITEEVAAPTKTAPKAATQTRTLNELQARTVAMLQHMLTHPDTTRIPVTLKGRQTTVTVDELQKLARTSPDKAKFVSDMIRGRAAELAKAAPESFPETPLVRYSTRAGEFIPESGVNVDSLQKLLQTGKLPGTAISHGVTDTTTNPLEQAVAQYAVHSKEDLGNLFLRQISGQHVSVGDYLAQLGVKASPVRSNLERLTEALSAKAPVGKKEGFKFDFEKDTPAVQKAVETVTKRVGLTKAERAAWIKSHDFLSPDEQKSLLASRSVTEFKNKVAKIMASPKTSVTDINELAAAIESGRVDSKDLQKLLSTTGGKSFAGAKQRYERIVTALAKAEHDMLNPTTAKVVSREQIGKDLAAEVKPADQIVDDVSRTGTSNVLDTSQETLDSSQQALLHESLVNGVAKNFIDPKNPAIYAYRTAKNVPRTAPKFGRGIGNHPQSWNKFAQLDAFRTLVSPKINKVLDEAFKKVSEQLPKAGRVYAQNSVKYDYIMPILRAQEKVLKAAGIPPVLGDAITGPTLSILDVLDALPKDFVIRTLFDGTKRAQSIFFTQFSDIAERIIAHGMGQLTEDELRLSIADAIRAPLDSVGRMSKAPLYSGLAKNVWAKAKNDPQAAADTLKSVVDTFIDAAPEIMQKYAANQAEYAMHFGAAVPQVSNAVMDKVSQMFLDPNYSPGDLIQVSTKIDNLARLTAKQLGITDPFTVDTAAKAAQLKAAQIIPPRMQAEGRAATQFAAAGDNVNQIAAVGARQAKNDASTAEQLVSAIADPTEFDDALEISKLDRMSDAKFITRGLVGFFPHIGNQELRPLLNEATSHTQYIAKRIAGNLNDISKRYSSEGILSAWQHLQNRIVPEESEALQAYKELKPVVNTIFDPSPANWFMRNGVTVAQMNSKLDKYKIPHMFSLEHMNSWQEWNDVKDPLELMSKYHAAAQASLNERMIANNIMSNPEWTSDVAKPGFVRIKGKGLLPHLLDTSKYYDREVASQFSTLNKAMEEAVKSTSEGTFIKTYDSTLHSLKAGFTIYRIGHHIRNMVSDMYFSWIAGVNNPRYYKDAVKVLKVIKGDTKDFNATMALQSMGIEAVDPAKAITKVKVGGQTIGLNAQNVFKLAVKHGIITDYTTVEDISDTSLSHFLAQKSPFKGKIHRAAAHVSESREYLARLPHFMHELEHGSYKTLDEAGQKAGNVVRKWHPDGSDLGTTEKKYARRVILFYSWMRKAIPLTIESAVYHPGKVLAYPKAYYAIAKANGIDLNGFGDPYPTDQIFPDWITSNITGPLFGSASNGYFSVSPGIPTNDIANQFGTNPKSAAMQLLGSVNPALRVPIETVYGHQAATGSAIKDKSDYVDQQVPFLSTLSSLTNQSASSGFTQPVHSVASGKEPGGFDWTAFANWLSGAGINNISRYSYGGK